MPRDAGANSLRAAATSGQFLQVLADDLFREVRHDLPHDTLDHFGRQLEESEKLGATLFEARRLSKARRHLREGALDELGTLGRVTADHGGSIRS